jgi:hypothetical protein
MKKKRTKKETKTYLELAYSHTKRAAEMPVGDLFSSAKS